MEKKTLRLPDGTTTTSTADYLSAWEEFARPICEATDMYLYGFDPGIAISHKGRTLSLPNWFVVAMNKALKEEK